MLLGAACLWDAAVEGFSAGEWTHTGSLYPSYALVLGAYAATREWEKWTDPYEQGAYWGNWFVLAWCLLPAALWLAGAMGAATVWPANLNTALASVLGVFTGCKASGLLWANKLKAGWGLPATPTAPSETQEPVDLIAQACRKRGTCTIQQITDGTGVAFFSVRGHIGWLVKSGSVRKQSKDLY
jgi:hypothetical protein